MIPISEKLRRRKIDPNGRQLAALQVSVIEMNAKIVYRMFSQHVHCLKHAIER